MRRLPPQRRGSVVRRLTSSLLSGDGGAIRAALSIDADDQQRLRGQIALRFFRDLLPSLNAFGGTNEDALELVRLGVLALAVDQPPRTRLSGALRFLRGGSATNEDDDGVRIVMLANALKTFVSLSAEGWSLDLSAAANSLDTIDPALAAIAPAALGRFLARLGRGGRGNAISGIIAEILIATRTLGTSPKASRSEVLRRVSKALVAHSRE